ncbi:hypothetical protein [Jiangella mangrovi]|uniref:Helix-hairpin-helix domain-containing protein n=1 Tax=Jiangella mangrovi TaxID=1524084 RepID=A0A7W9LMQ6_9ACTN|nr:hypothetical protein [Jiangella mangrovi]MBB5789491.1 hypothetical protein [Jiangella mangrovi]
MTRQDSFGERLVRGIGQTLWVLIPLLSVTFLAWLPAAQAWWRARTTGWFITALVLLLGSAGVVVLMAGPEDGGAAAGGLLIIGTLVGGIVAALKARPVVFRRREEVVELPPYPAAAPGATGAGAVADLRDHPAVREVLADRERRQQARDLIARDPAMAVELNLARPDVPDVVDDGGLVDLNNTGAGGLAAALGWPRETAEAFVVARDLRGGYQSLDEIAALSGLAPQLLERDAERIVVLPYRPA